MDETTSLVQFEVSGCLTTCAHCWALGGAYGAMPLDDAAFALEELAGYCGERGLPYTTYPMHEVTAHPRAPDVIRLFAPHLGGAYDPILTPGAPLASRPDWEDVVAAAKECGATAIWVHFHGYGAEHDRQLMRPGAFEETCLAVRRARESGLETGANVFLTKPALAEIDRLLAVLEELEVRLSVGTESTIGPARYEPHARGRRYEELRPELGDLVPIAGRVSDLLGFEWWHDLEDCTEAAWVRRMLEGESPGEEPWPMQRLLVVRPNLDVFTGTTGAYRRRHGNLRRDGARRVLESAFADRPTTREGLYFGAVEDVSTGELATRWGDPRGTKVYSRLSLRWRWLDQSRGRYPPAPPTSP